MTECGTSAGITHISPGSICFVSSPIVKLIEPRSRIPVCSLTWWCSGTCVFGSSSISAKVASAPSTARATTPFQILIGARSLAFVKAVMAARLSGRLVRARREAQVAEQRRGFLNETVVLADAAERADREGLQDRATLLEHAGGRALDAVAPPGDRVNLEIRERGGHGEPPPPARELRVEWIRDQPHRRVDVAASELELRAHLEHER